MYHSFLIHLCANGHLGCFHVLAIINSAAMNIGAHVSLSILVSSVCAQQWDCWVIRQFYFQFFKEFKSRDITLPTKVHLVKAMVFPVVMYGCESWTVKKAEHRRIDAFELWYWRRLLRLPWTARRSNQSILKEINPGISLEGMMLKLKLQFFGHLM